MLLTLSLFPQNGSKICLSGVLKSQVTIPLRSGYHNIHEITSKPSQQHSSWSHFVHPMEMLL